MAHVPSTSLMTTNLLSRSLLAGITLALAVACHQKPTRTDGRSEAVIEVTDSVWDFGTYKGDSIKQHASFKLKNVGAEPFVIHDIRTTCGCTETQYSPEPVEPGKETTIKVVYNGKGKSFGTFAKTLTVFTNAKSGLVYLTIKGNMIQ